MIDTLCGGVVLAVKEAVHQCRAHPPIGWPQAAYSLIGRKDLSQHSDGQAVTSARSQVSPQVLRPGQEEADGMEFLDQEVNEETVTERNIFCKMVGFYNDMRKFSYYTISLLSC